MVELIAKNTIQRVLDGKFVSHAPDTRFEMPDADAEQLVRIRAAVYANPQDVVPEPELKAELEANVSGPEPATEPAPADDVAASGADTEAELKAEPEAAPKRARKAKSQAAE